VLAAQSAKLVAHAAGAEKRLNAAGAALDRVSAAAAARVAVMIDEAQQRLADLEAEASRIGAAARARVESACESAAAVLGHDPRMGDGGAPATGSLPEVTVRAESAARHSDEAILRLSAMTERAAEVETALGRAVEQAGARAAMLERAMGEAAEQAAGLVKVARDVGGLLTSATRAGEVGRGAKDARMMTRRAPMTAPRPREEMGGASGVAA
jgi:hypothetical protein